MTDDRRAALVEMPAREDTAVRRYHVRARRSSDFSLLTQDFPIERGNWRRAARAALGYMAQLRGRGFDEFTTEFRLSEPVDLWALLEKEARDG